MKTITLQADEKLLAAAHDRARAEHTTLDELFQAWLEDYVQREQQAANAREVMHALRGQLRVGRKLTREEMNER